MRTPCATTCTSIHYCDEGGWEHVATALATRYEARPTARRGIVNCPPGWRWWSVLSDYDLWLVTQGSGKLRLANETYQLQPGSLLFLRPGDEGRATQDPENRLTVVYVHLDFFTLGQGTPSPVPISWLPFRYILFEDLSLIEPYMVRVVRLLTSRAYLAEIEEQSVLRQALIQIYRQDAANHGVQVPTIDQRIDRVLAHIKNAPHKRLTLEQAASLACLSPGYFSRLFSLEVGVSFRDYVLQVRLEQARYLLEETDMTVGQIAASLGYDDTFLFSRQFKKRYAAPPSHVRGNLQSSIG